MNKTRRIGGYPVKVMFETDDYLIGQRLDTDAEMWEVHRVRPHKTEFLKTGIKDKMLNYYNELTDV